jgi:hypothetical protein
MSKGTPGTSGAGETELHNLKVDELRERARKEGVHAPSHMKKDELVAALSGNRQDSGGSGGGLHTGKQTSKSLKYSQEIDSPDDEPERPGRSLATTSHDVIRQWAEKRGGKPATVDGTEHGDHLGVLRFDFGGDNERLREVSWDEWFRTFDDRKLNFLYQEQRSDGKQSNFFQFESPDREDA